MSVQHETITFHGTLKLWGRYVTSAGRQLRVICIDRRNAFPVVALTDDAGGENPAPVTSDGWLAPAVSRQTNECVTEELTGYTLSDPDNPGAYWCETLNPRNRSGGYRWWDGKTWGMAFQRKRDCFEQRMGTRKSSRTQPLRWKDKK